MKKSEHIQIDLFAPPRPVYDPHRWHPGEHVLFCWPNPEKRYDALALPAKVIGAAGDYIYVEIPDANHRFWMPANGKMLNVDPICWLMQPLGWPEEDVAA